MCYDLFKEMEEELKETAKSLAESVKTVQAEMLTHINEVTRSDNSNLFTSLQLSNFISGIHPAATKRRRIMVKWYDIKLITDDETEDEEDKTGKPETLQTLLE